jgi:hypothetical protein
MPCPYFEPHTVVAHPKHSNARLPLLDEYDGLCRAIPVVESVPAERRFTSCNQGYSRGCCEHFPAAEPRSALRYSVISYSAAVLQILCIEEQNYAPLRWHPAQYFPNTGRLEPEISDLCMRAQILAFCRSYLERFPPAS